MERIEYIKIKTRTGWNIYQIYHTDSFRLNYVCIHQLVKCNNNAVLHISGIEKLPEGVAFDGICNTSITKKQHTAHLVFTVEKKPEFWNPSYMVRYLNDIIKAYTSNE